MGQEIDIIRPKVTLKIGDTKIEMEHQDIENLLYKLAAHLGKYVYQAPYFYGHNVFTNNAGVGYLNGTAGGNGFSATSGANICSNIEIGESR